MFGAIAAPCLAFALGLDALSNRDAVGGLQAALTQAAEAAGPENTLARKRRKTGSSIEMDLASMCNNR